MANVKITDLSAIADPASTDVLPVVDVTADTTNKISIADILKTAPEGTAAAPAIAFEGDSNTGIYHPGSEQIGFATSGIGRVFIASDGNLGVGASDPTNLLHLRKDSAHSILLERTGGAPSEVIFANQGNTAVISNNVSGIAFQTGETPSEAMRIDSSGKVGIGVSSPLEVLHIRAGNSGVASAFGGVDGVIIETGASRTGGLIMHTPNDRAAGIFFSDPDGAGRGYYRYEHSDDYASIGTAGSERLRIDSSGSVGIGTSNPQQKLHVANAGDVQIQLQNNGTSGLNSAFIAKIDSDDSLKIQSSGGTTATPLTFAVKTNSEAARIDTSGRLLVGTSSAPPPVETITPIFALSSASSANDGYTAGIYSYRNAGGSGRQTVSPRLLFARSRSGVNGSVGGIVAANDDIGNIRFAADDGTQFVTAAEILAEVDGTPGTNDMPGRLVFSTTAPTGSSPTPRMRIDSNGSVGIGTNSPSQKLEVANGDALIYGITVGRGSGAIDSNTVVGFEALQSNTIGTNNTATGRGALGSNTEGFNNTANGKDSLLNNTTGINNTANGVNALLKNTTGSNNTANGRDALVFNTTGNNNTAIGRSTLAANTTGGNGTAIGYESQRFANDTTTPYTNTNVSVGFQSLRGSTTAANNTGLNNTAVGYQALVANTSGDDNTAIGREALFSNTTGDSNTALGLSALFSNTEGVFNVANGYTALRSNTTGDNNTALGRSAGRFKQDGTDATDFSNCSYLGYNTRASGSDQVQLGDSNTTTYVYGTVQSRSDARDKTDIRDTLLGLEFVNSLRPVDFRWDMRDDYFDREEYQEDELRTRQVPNPEYTEDGDEPEFIEEEYTETVTKERLVPVTKDGSRSRVRFHHGLIAQEVKAAADAQDIDFAGYQDHSVKGGLDVLSIGYTEMIAPLIKAVQELSVENAALKKRLDDAGL